MKSHKLCATIAIFCATISSGLCQGTILFQHLGAKNPVNEGFTLSTSGSPLLSPVPGDLGVDAWAININNPSTDIAVYNVPPTPENVAALTLARDWSLSVTLRILSPFNEPSGGELVVFYTGTAVFAFRFGATDNGDPIVRVPGVNHSVVGSGYHNYQLRFDAAANAASLWIDGVDIANGISGSPSLNEPRFWWGASQGAAGIERVNWNEVTLSVIPEPSAVALILLGAGLLLRPRFTAAA